MVLSGGFKKFLKSKRGMGIKETVLSTRFWNNCLIIVKIMEPLMRLLRICDTDEKPSLSYIYEGLSRAIKGIRELFKNIESRYKPFVDIINNRWDKMLRKRLHVDAYWLNPAFQYDPNCPLHDDPKVYKGFLGIIEDLLGDVPGIMNEVTMFREGKKSFGMKLAQREAKSTAPDEWWRLFGIDAPNLQRLAIRILSQTSASSGCERNWSVFERIHTKRRNRLEHQRLNDLVFVHYNLRLKSRSKNLRKNYDPIDYECIDKVDDWVIEDVSNGELDYDEIEEALEQDLNENSQPEEGEKEMDNDNHDDEIDFTNIDLGRT